MKKDDTKNLHEYVVKCIKEDILAGVYIPGEILPSENQLASKYGVSRTTIREGIKLLGEMNVVETKRGIGSILKKDDLVTNFENDIVNLLGNKKISFLQASDLLTIIEPSLIKQVTHIITADELANLKMILEKIDNEDTVDGKIKYINYFHKSLIAVLKNDLINIFYKLICEMVIEPKNFEIHGKKDSVEMLNRAQQDHWRIYNYIVKGDEELVYLSAKEHIMNKNQRHQSYYNEYCEQTSLNK